MPLHPQRQRLEPLEEHEGVERRHGRADVAQLAQALTRAGIGYTSLDIHDSSLEDIFVGLLGKREAA
jgi:hypothetical protein